MKVSSIGKLDLFGLFILDHLKEVLLLDWVKGGDQTGKDSKLILCFIASVLKLRHHHVYSAEEEIYGTTGFATLDGDVCLICI